MSCGECNWKTARMSLLIYEVPRNVFSDIQLRFEIHGLHRLATLLSKSAIMSSLHEPSEINECSLGIIKPRI
ncbi:hypothetical protein EG68_00424 [Paragonimus skrjabini miyazakii]|uniref:Uncharacterized protein n=1 Tax=Paragonimus skrjabini miyazakii TaxID=59628 RepID=A0A8S9Z993_9TREM|nr:hypothetical protein EG68_00424 [Paragonimus skrjabini miyazakii]